MKLTQITKEIQDLLNKEWTPASQKRVAGLLVDARLEYFLDREGNPDYQGRSWAYRQWVAEIVDSLNLSSTERSRLLGRLRFHSGNILRERVDAETLEAHGLLSKSPAMRGKDNFEQRSEPYRIIRSGQRLKTDEELKQVADLLDSISKRIDTSEANAQTSSVLKRALDNLNTTI